MGTSTAGIHHSELAYRGRDADALPDWFDYRHTQNLFSTADFVAQALQLSGHALSISTACSSSAKVFAAAYRAIRMGLCDAAVVGGVDSLCLTTLYGFNSLQLVAAEVCRPADSGRSGISIGEAAGFALVESPDRASADFAVLGYGETSDAHHMSSPDPEGRGAAAAMRAALSRAGRQSVDYINLHGTGTQANDAAEDQAVFDVFGDAPCSSTKGWTGHTLGAAGIVEAVLSLQCMQQGLLPRSLQTRSKDPAFRSNVLLETCHATVNTVMSNSFGFGGSNCSLILGRAQ
jgi:3-oxoacyl-[acyl-carrier-protein] synthase-1